MKFEAFLSLLERIKGCTFATLDTETSPKPGIRKVTTGEQVILFTNKHKSGYEGMVRRRLEQLGKDPNSFSVSDLPWGERVPETPLILHKEKYYLQTVLLHPGNTVFYCGDYVVNPEAFGIRERRTNQGLPKGKEVLVSCYRLDHIVRIALLGDVFSPKAQG